MPTVPDRIQDPFNTKVPGKDQARLPEGGPPPEYLLMAAGTMAKMGRLFSPPELGTDPMLEKARAEYWAQAEPKAP